MPHEKETRNLTQKWKDPLLESLPTADLERDTHREKPKIKEGLAKGEERLNLMEICEETGQRENDSTGLAKENESPLAMSFIQGNGWVTKTLGPNSGHWKWLARKVNKKNPCELSPSAKPSSRKTKRKGSVPSQEVDPNVLSFK